MWPASVCGQPAWVAPRPGSTRRGRAVRLGARGPGWAARPSVLPGAPSRVRPSRVARPGQYGRREPGWSGRPATLPGRPWRTAPSVSRPSCSSSSRTTRRGLPRRATRGLVGAVALAATRSSRAWAGRRRPRRRRPPHGHQSARGQSPTPAPRGEGSVWQVERTAVLDRLETLRARLRLLVSDRRALPPRMVPVRQPRHAPPADAPPLPVWQRRVVHRGRAVGGSDPIAVGERPGRLGANGGTPRLPSETALCSRTRAEAQRRACAWSAAMPERCRDA